METDLTEIVMISVDVLSDIEGRGIYVTTVRRNLDGVINGFLTLPGVPAEPSANPGKWIFDASHLDGSHEIGVLWTIFPPIVGFADNITFHPVPEPSSWLLLSLGIAGMVMIRRKLAPRV